MKPDQQGIQASVLDRLIDSEPGITTEPVQKRLSDIRQVKNSVIRDLENLLNARRIILPLSAEYRELSNSLYVYGVRDFTSLDPRNEAVKQKLRNDIKQTIARFDKRLKNITVNIETSEEIQNIRFRINALMVVDPISEPVTFDTYFDINKGEYVISR